ncbi:MAG: GAF domain-containing protein [Muribaculaceae bacterium]
MAEHLEISSGTKAEKYALLLRQIEAVAEGESDMIANMANVAAMIHETFGFWWTGFYRVAGDSLVLGPFQGPLACSRIRRGRGVCGTAWAEAATQVVPDVDRFPGHIACSSASRSEIVVPVMVGGTVTAVLDIDSRYLNTFDDVDRLWLERIAAVLAKAGQSEN